MCVQYLCSALHGTYKQICDVYFVNAIHCTSDTFFSKKLAIYYTYMALVRRPYQQSRCIIK